MSSSGDAATWLPVVTAVLSTLVTIGSLTWKLSGNMNKIAQAAKDTADTVAAAARISLAEHEDKDQERHEENLQRFQRIFVALAKLGSNTNNGD